MVADWEFEIGGDAPVIEAWWAGFVDLRRSPASIVEIPEAIEIPVLGDALICLNNPHSLVWTSKCGLWTSDEPDQFDADEFGAPSGSTAFTHGCYIDLLPRNQEQWPNPDAVAATCKSWIAKLLRLPLRSCRADLIIRRAFTPPERMHLAVTAYLTGSGSTAGEAQAAFEAALTPFAHVLCSDSTLQ
jgi:hypothetical protein